MWLIVQSSILKKPLLDRLRQYNDENWQYHPKLNYFSSPEPKALMSCPLSVVRRCRRRRRHSRKLFTFSSSSPEPLGQLKKKTWNKAFLGEGDSSLLKWRAPPFPKGDNYKIAKIYWGNSKIFSRTTGRISTKLSTEHPWVKRIQIC